MTNIAHLPFAGRKPAAPPPRPCLAEPGQACRLRLQFAVFFDGTNNNREEDMPSLFNRRRETGFRTLRWVLLSLLLCTGVACKARNDADETFGSTVIAMDHEPSDTFVRNVYINGRWVGQAGRGGKMFSSGISLPAHWRPGLTAEVKWERCDRFDRENPVPDEQACRWTEKVVPIQQYDEVGHTDVHIMAGDRVLIIPTMLDPKHPDYPGPGYPTKNFFKPKDKDATP